MRQLINGIAKAKTSGLAAPSKGRTMNGNRYWLACMALVIAMAGPVHAGMITAVQNTTPQLEYGNGGTIGWEFRVNSAITVTTLGWFDGYDELYGVGSGLFEAHEIGIWNTSGDLLVTGTVLEAAGSPLDGSFRYASVSETLLAPGQDYVIAGYTGGYDVDAAFDVVATASAITYLDGRHTTGTFQFPTNTGQPSSGFSGNFGPNFQFVSAASVPEPSSLALLGMGGLTLLGWRRRSHSKD